MLSSSILSFSSFLNLLIRLPRKMVCQYVSDNYHSIRSCWYTQNGGISFLGRTVSSRNDFMLCEESIEVSPPAHPPAPVSLRSSSLHGAATSP
mmetsp:Transcript_48153/g.151071  ORF Transcript_48153/g.151071 Transcript_48153/m.151071 type:complete len:93 (-) Transcript_48153:6-284(-)